MSDTIDLDIEGMTCAACVSRVEKVLGRVPGVTLAEVNLATHRARVRGADGLDIAKLAAAVAKAGYGASPVRPDRVEVQQLPWRLLVGALLTVPLAAPMLLGHRYMLPGWAQLLLTLPVQLWVAGPFYRAAWFGLRGLHGSMDALVVLGTSAVKHPEMIQEACRKFCQAIVVSIDARGGFVATHGWQQATELSVVSFARSMVDLGVRRFIYTDIGRDGTLTEPNFEVTAELVRKLKIPVIASGGISSQEHIRKLAKLGVEGAIIGKALYTGDIDLAEALAAS